MLRDEIEQVRRIAKELAEDAVEKAFVRLKAEFELKISNLEAAIAKKQAEKQK